MTRFRLLFHSLLVLACAVSVAQAQTPPSPVGATPPPVGATHASPLASMTTPTTSLVFQESSVVRGKEYALGDIARVETADPQQQLRLSCLVIGKSPSLGYRMNLSPRQLAMDLAKKGIKTTECSFVFPQSMMLEREAQTVEGKTIQDAVRKEVLAQLPEQQDGVIVDRIMLPAAFVVSAGEVSTQIDVRMPRRSVGNGSFSLDLLVDGESQRKISGSFQVDKEVAVLQLEKPIERGQPVDLQNCREVKKRLSLLPNRPLTVSDMDVPFRARRPLGAGEIISLTDVDREMLVQRGQTVRMVLESADGMKISTTGQARANGALGDSVDVVNLSSGRTVQGIVAGSQIVKVLF